MKATRRFVRARLPLLALLSLLVPAARATADNNLNLEMAELAKSVKVFLDDRGETAIAVGQYLGPIDLPSSSGPAIASALGAELKKLGVDVKLRGANFVVKGTYKLVEDGNSKDGLHAVAIESAIVNKKGEEAVGLNQIKPRGVYGDAAKAILLGLTYSLPPSGSDKGRDREVERACEDPKTFLDKTRIKAADSPFAIEILVKEGEQFVPRAAKDVDGQAFVELKKDEVYRVRVYNDSAYKGVAALSIDGLSMFQFSELRDPKNKDKPLYDRLLVAAHGSYDIPGWHRNNDKNGSYPFQATRYADNEAAGLFPDSANIGAITVTFAVCWPEDQEPPSDEPQDAADRARRLLSLTNDCKAFIGGIDTGYHPVEYRFGVIRAAVSARYNK